MTTSPGTPACCVEAPPGMAPHQREQREVVAGPGARHAAPGVEDPPRHHAFVRAQRPAPARGQVEEAERRTARSRQGALGTDRALVAGDGGVARQHEMVAVVDRHAEPAVMVGAASPAGLPRCLGQGDGKAAPGQRDRRRQAGESRADHVDARPAWQ